MVSSIICIRLLLSLFGDYTEVGSHSRIHCRYENKTAPSTTPIFSDNGTIFCIDSSSIRIVGTFFSVAITTPFVANHNQLSQIRTCHANGHFALINCIQSVFNLKQLSGRTECCQGERIGMIHFQECKLMGRIEEEIGFLGLSPS